MTRARGLCLLALLAAGCSALLATGCSAPATTEPPKGPDTQKEAAVVPLTLVVVDDTPLADAIRREWQARSKAPLEVVPILSPDGMPLGAPSGDIVVISANRLGEYAEKNWIVPLPDVSLRALDAERADFSPFALQQECYWGGALWGIPLGSTGFTLYVRSDLLRDNKLTLPTTWEEYATVVRRLRSSAWAKEEKHVVAAEPLASGWGGLLLLARAAPYVRHRGNYSTYFDFQTMEPLLTSPPMVKALEELVAAADPNDKQAGERTPADCLDLFWSGDAALAIAFPGHPAKKGAATKLSPEHVAVAELPGSPQVFNHSDKRWETRTETDPQRIPLMSVSGRVGALLTSSPNKIAAARALLLISGAEWSHAISPESVGTGPFRRTHLKEIGRWVESGDARLGQDLADLFAARFDAPLAMSPPRLPGGSRYLEALDLAVHSAVSGKEKPADALAKAAEAWRTITSELGLKGQKAAYRRSLGLKE